MNKIKYLVLIVVLVGLSFYLGNNQSKIQSPNQNPQPSDVKAETSSHLTGFYVGVNLVQIGQDEININPCEGECFRPGMNLDKKTYPELFKIYDKFTRIDAEEVMDFSDKKFIFFTNKVPDHGGYATLYGIIVDPESKRVIYTTPKELRSPLSFYQILPSMRVILFDMNPYLFNNSCTSCRLEIMETVIYDDKLKKYVSENVGSAPGFINILEKYEQAAKSCYYQGQKRTVEEVISLGGKDARCGDENMGNKPFTADSGAITVGEFQEIRSKIQRIIKGEELSLVHY